MTKTDIYCHNHDLKILKQNFLAITKHFKWLLKRDLAKYTRKIVYASQFLRKPKIANECLNSDLWILNESINDQNSLNQAHSSN